MKPRVWLQVVFDLADGSRAAYLASRVAERVQAFLSLLGVELHIPTSGCHHANRSSVRSDYASHVTDDELQIAFSAVFADVDRVLPWQRSGRTAISAILGEVESVLLLYLFARSLSRSSNRRTLILTPTALRADALRSAFSSVRPQRWLRVWSLPTGKSLSFYVPQFAEHASEEPCEAFDAGGTLLVAESRAMEEMLTPLANALGENSEVPASLISHAQSEALLKQLVEEASQTPTPSSQKQSDERSIAANQDILDLARAVVSRSESLILSWSRVESVAQRRLSSLSVRLVIVGNDRSALGSVLSLAARRAGLLTLAVQDGVAADRPHWWVQNAAVAGANGQHLADIRGARSRELPALPVVGQPRYDIAMEMLRCAKEGLGPRHNMVKENERECIVVVALQPGHDRSYVRALFEGVALAAEATSTPLRTVVRPHPSHRRSDIASLMPKKLLGQTEFHTSPNLPELLSRADIVISEFSTLLIEAAVYGAIPIAFEADELPLPLSLSHFGVARRARSVAELCDRVSEGVGEPLSGAEHARMLAAAQYLLGPLDGRATERLVALVNSMLAEDALVVSS